MTDEFKKSDEEAARNYAAEMNDYHDSDGVNVSDVFLAGIAHERKASAEREKVIEGLLDQAVIYLIQGKAKFTPNTTNSFVDEFIADHLLRKKRSEALKEGGA